MENAHIQPRSSSQDARYMGPEEENIKVLIAHL